MNHEEKIEQLLVTEFKQGKLLDIAAYALRHGLAQGYCEFVEHKELWELVGKFHCPFCGGQHRSKYHDELHKFYSDDTIYFKAVDDYSKKYPERAIIASPLDLIPYFPGFNKTLTEENPMEYTPD